MFNELIYYRNICVRRITYHLYECAHGHVPLISVRWQVTLPTGLVPSGTAETVAGAWIGVGEVEETCCCDQI